MNGPAGLAHLDRRERVLKLGESFEKQPRCAFHTVRCEYGLCGVPRVPPGWEGGMETDSPGFCNCPRGSLLPGRETGLKAEGSTTQLSASGQAPGVPQV